MTHPTSDLTALLDGALPPARAQEIRRHLAACAACRGEESRLRAAVSLLSELPPAAAPSPLFAARVEAHLRQHRARAPGLLAKLRGLRWSLLLPAGAIAAAAVVTTISLRHARGRDWAVAEHLELLDDFEAVSSLGDVEEPEDALVIEQLDTLQREGAR